MPNKRIQFILNVDNIIKHKCAQLLISVIIITRNLLIYPIWIPSKTTVTTSNPWIIL